MSEIKLGDNPSVETQLGMIAVAVNRLLEDTRDIKQETAQLKLYQREQNGNVALVKDDVRSLKEAHVEVVHRLDSHDDWHGEEDERIVNRLHQEELNKARANGKSEGVRTVLGIELNVVKWVAGGGLVGVGLAVGKLVNLIGWW